MKITAKGFVMATVLVLLLAALPMNALAAGNTLTGADESRNVDVRAKYVDGTSTPDVYSIDVVWGAMQFTYSSSGTREWDPATHRYTGSITGTWAATGNTVTVTNHSNKAVGVAFSYEKAAGFDSIGGAFSIGSDTLAAGVEGNVAGADSVRTELTLSGTLPETVTEFTKIGSVTVSLR